MFFWRSKKTELEERIVHLEKQNIALSMTLQSLQSALLAMSKSQDSIAKDVENIQAIVAAFLAQVEQASEWHNFDPGDYEH